MCQAEHEQQRPAEPAGEDHQPEPGEVRAPQRRLRCRKAQHGAEGVDASKAKPGAQVEKPGHHPGAHRPEQDLGERRASAEQDCREKGEQDASAEHSGTLAQPGWIVARIR